MKEKFLALIEEVKNTGIVEELYKTSNAKELTAVWQDFYAKNQQLIAKINDWASEYKNSGAKAIFKEGETIENPMEIAVCIKVINVDVSECEIFSDWKDLLHQIEKIQNDFAVAVANFIKHEIIYIITAKDIFG